MLLCDVLTAADQITVSQAWQRRQQQQQLLRQHPISPLILPLRSMLNFLLKKRLACADPFLSD